MLSMSARGKRYLGVLFPLLAFGAVGVLVPSPADAHFKIDAPPSWMSQDTVGGPQKTGPCGAVPNTGLGDTAGTPTNTVSVVQSGQPISVSVTVTVPHPGWFRFALAEGASSTQTLATIADPQAQTGTNCTPAILANPIWSPTQPIIADGLPAGSTAGTVQSGNQTFSVTIPESASCTGAQPCTLQVIMVMTDHPAGDCYYHHCADISIGSATDAGTEVPVKPAPGCGCVLSSRGGASWAMVAAGLVALASVRRRRRRQVTAHRR
jgi:MYXO-CTERM domain-containing protein